MWLGECSCAASTLHISLGYCAVPFTYKDTATMASLASKVGVSLLVLLTCFDCTNAHGWVTKPVSKNEIEFHHWYVYRQDENPTYQMTSYLNLVLGLMACQLTSDTSRRAATMGTGLAMLGWAAARLAGPRTLIPPSASSTGSICMIRREYLYQRLFRARTSTSRSLSRLITVAKLGCRLPARRPSTRRTIG